MSICQQRWGRKEPFCKGLSNTYIPITSAQVERHAPQTRRPY